MKILHRDNGTSIMSVLEDVVPFRAELGSGTVLTREEEGGALVLILNVDRVFRGERIAVNSIAWLWSSEIEPMVVIKGKGADGKEILETLPYGWWTE